MSDDGPNEDVIALESQDIEIQELPEFPDREEFVRTQEMDSPLRDTVPKREHASTKPIQPVLEQTTQRYDVPDSLLEEARRTHRGDEAAPWVEFEARPDDEGRIRLPPEVQRSLGSDTLLVRVRLADSADK